MVFRNCITVATLALSLSLLAGCAENQAKPGDGTDGQGTATNSAASIKAAKIAQARQLALPPAVVPNPSVVQFEKMSTNLDDKATVVIAQSSERARLSSKITVTGFCDRKQIGNPGEAAVARAIAVRDEYVLLGIPPAKILVKFDTSVAKKHAAEIRFE